MIEELSSLDNLSGGFVLSLYGGAKGRVRNTIHPWDCIHIKRMTMLKRKIWATTVEELEQWLEKQGGSLDPDLPRCSCCPQIREEPSDYLLEIMALHVWGVVQPISQRHKAWGKPICAKCSSPRWIVTFSDTSYLDLDEKSMHFYPIGSNEVVVYCADCEKKPATRERTLVLQSEPLRYKRLQVGRRRFDDYEDDDDESDDNNDPEQTILVDG